MKNGLIAALVVLLVCVSMSSVQAYTNEEYNFSIDPPSGWTVDDTVTFAVVMFYGPIEEGEGGVLYIMNINIQVESTTLTLEQYVSASKDRLPIIFGNYELVSEETRVINGVDAIELVHTFTQAGIDLKGKQVILLKAKKAYVITYGSLSNTYQKYLSAFESSVETFRILEPEPTPWYIQYWYVWVIIAVAVAAPLAFYLIRRRAKAVPPPTAPAPPTPPPAEAPPTAPVVSGSRFPTNS